MGYPIFIYTIRTFIDVFYAHHCQSCADEWFCIIIITITFCYIQNEWICYIILRHVKRNNKGRPFILVTGRPQTRFEPSIFRYLETTVLYCLFLHFLSHSALSHIFKMSLPVPVVQHSPCLYWAKVMYCLLSGSIILKTTSRLESSNRFGPLTPLCWDSFSCSSFSIRNSRGFSEKNTHKNNLKQTNHGGNMVMIN